jgi:hypothetical protein
MTYYGIEWSVLIPAVTDEQRNWLLEEIAKELEEYDDTPACYEPQVEKDGSVWVWDDGFQGNNLDRLLDLVAAYQNQFDLQEPWKMRWSYTCSKPRLDAFGGGAAVVWRGYVRTISIEDEVEKLLKDEEAFFSEA